MPNNVLNCMEWYPLILLGADPFIEYRYHGSAVHYAFKSADYYLVAELCANQPIEKIKAVLANPDCCAIVNNQLLLYHCLKYFELDPNAFYQNKPLLIYALTTNIECVKILLHYDANINIQLPDGKYPIYYAIETQNIDMVKLLLTHDPDLTVTFKGQSPYFYAKSMPDKSIANCILQKMQRLSNAPTLFMWRNGNNTNSVQCENNLHSKLKSLSAARNISGMSNHKRS